MTSLERIALHNALVSAGLPLVSITDDVPVYSRTLTAPEQATSNSLVASFSSLAATYVRNRAKALLDNLRDDIADLLRVIVVRVVSELNLIRTRLRAQDAAISAATSLANLQSRWATAASANPMPDRTKEVVKQALKDDLDAGLGEF